MAPDWLTRVRFFEAPVMEESKLMSPPPVVTSRLPPSVVADWKVTGSAVVVTDAAMEIPAEAVRVTAPSEAIGEEDGILKVPAFAFRRTVPPLEVLIPADSKEMEADVTSTPAPVVAIPRRVVEPVALICRVPAETRAKTFTALALAIVT